MGQFSDGLIADAGTYRADIAMPLHTHDEARLVLQLKGATRHTVRREPHLVTPSTLLLIPAGEPHADRFLEASDAFIVRLETSWLSRYPQVAPHLQTPGHFQGDAAAALALRMHREAAAPDSLSALMLDGLALELLAVAARSGAPPTESATPRWLRQAQELLHARFTEELHLDAVAEAVGVHPDHLMRTFRQRHRVTIGAYVRRLRIERACSLLATSEMSVTQVAHAVGFRQQSHFCRAFKAQVGETPSAFQRRASPIAPVQ